MNIHDVTVKQIKALGYTISEAVDLQFTTAYKHESLPAFLYFIKKNDLLAYIDFGSFNDKHDDSSVKENFLSIDFSMGTIGEYWIPNNITPFNDFEPSNVCYSLWYCGAMAELQRILGEPFDGCL